MAPKQNRLSVEVDGNEKLSLEMKVPANNGVQHPPTVASNSDLSVFAASKYQWRLTICPNYGAISLPNKIAAPQ